MYNKGMFIMDDQTIACPHCGQMIDITIDGSVPDHEYIEDCQVCCRPIVLRVHIDQDLHATVDARMEIE